MPRYDCGGQAIAGSGSAITSLGAPIFGRLGRNRPDRALGAIRAKDFRLANSKAPAQTIKRDRDGRARSNIRCRNDRPAKFRAQKNGPKPVFLNPTMTRGDYSATTPSPSSTALIDRRMRPCLSTSSTLTLTMSPSLSLSLTYSTRTLEICDTWTRPSLPGRIVTNAPKSMILATLPS
jgi:hypothetical protein